MDTAPDPALRDSWSDEGSKTGNLQPCGVNGAVQREPQEPWGPTPQARASEGETLELCVEGWIGMAREGKSRGNSM